MCKSFDEIRYFQNKILRVSSEMTSWDKASNAAKTLKKMLKIDDSDWKAKNTESFDSDV
jgi:hypothetical protein